MDCTIIDTGIIILVSLELVSLLLLGSNNTIESYNKSDIKNSILNNEQIQWIFLSIISSSSLVTIVNVLSSKIAKLEGLKYYYIQWIDLLIQFYRFFGIIVVPYYFMLSM